MGGFFGVVSKRDCVEDLYFGVDYHSHLGTSRGGLAVWHDHAFHRAIHNIENAPFRTKFEKEIDLFEGTMGIGCISDCEAQPLLIHSHLGTYAITSVGRINNKDDLIKECFELGVSHFLEMSGGEINSTELVSALINQKESIEQGLAYVMEKVRGSMSVLVLNEEGIYCMRDKFGRTPVILAKKKDAYCVTFESSAFLNLGYQHVVDVGPGEIVLFTSDGYKVLKEKNEQMKICSFLWVYYGYPTSNYEGSNVELARNKCGSCMAKRFKEQVDLVAGVPESGIANAIGFSNEAHLRYGRPFIKYTPTWPRSFMPTNQIERNLIASMKLIPIRDLIKDQRLLMIDDSLVRGTQLGNTSSFLYESGAKQVHVALSCPPIMFGCKFLNFSRTSSELELITRRMIQKIEGIEVVDQKILLEYANPDSDKHKLMIQEIQKEINVTSVHYARLDELVKSIGLDESCLCTYCMSGKEE